MTAELQRHLSAIREQGFVVIEGLLDHAELQAIRTALAPRLDSRLLGRNPFEGHRTERVYTLVAQAPVFAGLVEHPRILAICDALLSPNYLLSISQAINIHPGESAQPLHTDDIFYEVPRPRAAYSVSTIWAIDDFTETNGATEVIPESHLWGDSAVERLLHGTDFATRRGAEQERAHRPVDDPAMLRQLRTVCMPAGSVLVFLGTLVHRGGANRSEAARLALTNQYCAPWARQQENYSLAVPPAVACRMSARVQQLLGYSIHPPFMGHVHGLHPRRVLEAAAEQT